jgi:hypothetical protein
MCFQFKPPPVDPPPPGMDALVGDLLMYLEAWASFHLLGVDTASEACRIVQAETEKLQHYAELREAEK